MRFAMAQGFFKKIGLGLPALFRIRLRAAIRRGRGILGGLFLRGLEEGRGFLRGLLSRTFPEVSYSYLQHLARLRTLEGALAADLGSLAQAALGQGLRERSRQYARQAFVHWCRARRAEARLLRKPGDPVRQAAL